MKTMFTLRAAARLALLVSALGFDLPTAAAAAAAADQNWPQWRGPQGTGLAPAGSPPITWSETSNLKWKVKIPGGGLSTPIIWDNRVFVQTALPAANKNAAAGAAPADQPGTPPRRRPGGGGGGGQQPSEAYQCVLLCLDRQTGKTLWQQTAREETPNEGHHSDGSYAAYSPVTDGQLVFAYFGSRGLHCYDLEGNLKWSQDFGDMRIANGFGEGSSPVLSGDTVVVNWDHEGDSFIIALDKHTGKTLWKQTRDERTSWATPLLVQHEGKTQVVTAATRKIRSYDLATGKLLWECAGLTANVIPTPVAGNGLVYAISGFRGNALLAIRLGRAGDLTGTDAIAWSYHRSTPYVPSPLLCGDRLYFFAGNIGVLTCFNAKTGGLLIDAERLDALQGVYASPVGAGGRVYLTGRNGATVVIKQSDKIEMLATNRLDDRIDASPAVAGGELFLRGRNSLYCIAEK